MPLLNYTTSINVDKTISEIAAMLAKAKAKAILTDFDGCGNVTALSFRIQTPFGEISFRLPANVEATAKVIDQQATRGAIPRRYRGDKAQASRVAWRIVKDWLEAQLAILETQSVTFEQVMLPFALDPNNNQTVYEKLLNQRFSGLALPAPQS